MQLHGSSERTQGNALAVVLNVEDFEPVRFLRTQALERAGFTVVEAGSAADALQLMETHAPDLALVDVDLPDSDGFQLCAALVRASPSLPVLLISAVHLEAWTRDVGTTVGASGYLREPVDAETLVARVRLALGGVKDEPSIYWVITDVFGTILDISPAAAAMLDDTGRRKFAGRSLLMYFTRDREDWATALQRAVSGALVQKEGVVRPARRRPVEVEVEIARVRDTDPSDLKFTWMFRAPIR